MTDTAGVGAGTRPRLVSLDAFRGLTIAGMILVNNPGSWSYVYPPLRHAEWHGWTPTDLIFPFFLFIVGVAMRFSLLARQQAGTDLRALNRKVIVRSLIIVGLGLFMAGFPNFPIGTMRLPGVLQRIGVAYFVAASIVLRTGLRGQAAAVAVLLLGYWALMMLVPVPGFGAGDLSPEGNLGAFLDRAVFGHHLWQDRWDPEGILSTLPAIATTLTGVLVGHLLHSRLDRRAVTGWLFIVGWGAILAGLAWSIWFPINKNIWTSSYVLFTSGAACQFLGVCYWLIDVEGRRGWATPAVIFGMNAIAVFVASGLMARMMIRMHAADGRTVYTWIYDTLFVPWAGPLNGSLAFAVATVLFWYGMMWLLYRRKIFIKI